MELPITNRKLLLLSCVFSFAILILICFLLWTYTSYHVLKFLRKNIEEKLYFDSYKSGCIKTLEKYGDLPIKRIYLVRSHVNSILTFLLDVTTWKNYSAQLQNYRKMTNNNAFFPSHTYMMVEVELDDKTRKNLVIEKTNGVDVTANFRKYESQEMLKVSLKKSDKFTINQILETTKERMGDQPFFNWHLYKNNCQQFTKEILNSMGKTDPIYDEFNSEPRIYEAIKLSDPVMYMINCAINVASFVESFCYDFKL